MRLFWTVLVLILVAVAVRMSAYTVDASEYVYVTLLGKHLETYDGGSSEAAGLNWGWPWPVQSVQRLDRRLQHFDLDGTELLTHDPDGKTIDKTLAVQAYVCWRIADVEAVDRFLRRMGTVDQARAILGQRINSQLGAAIGRMRMDDLVSTDPGKAAGSTRVDEKIQELQSNLLVGLKEQVNTEYGIELVDIRLRRFNHPVDVRSSIFDRIRSERNKKAAEYRAEGERLARNIESEAEEKVRALLAKARAEEEKLKGQADTEAAMIRNQAHSKDPEFYAFLKKLDKLQSILGDNKTVLLLSSHRPIFDLLFQPPGPNGASLNNGSVKKDNPKTNGPAGSKTGPNSKTGSGTAPASPSSPNGGP
jgi:membrane protease subunit HflC